MTVVDTRTGFRSYILPAPAAIYPAQVVGKGGGIQIAVSEWGGVRVHSLKFMKGKD
jgi:hypothetical protein